MIHGGTVHLRVCPVRLMRIMEEEEDARAWFMAARYTCACALCV